MMTLPLIFGVPYPEITLIFTFCIAFHIFVVDEQRLQIWCAG